jgi:hypothetical protein
MKMRGKCWDNDSTKIFFRTMKREPGLRKSNLSGVAEVEAVLNDWIEIWFIIKRRQPLIYYCCPAEKEAR